MRRSYTSRRPAAATERSSSASLRGRARIKKRRRPQGEFHLFPLCLSDDKMGAERRAAAFEPRNVPVRARSLFLHCFTCAGSRVSPGRISVPAFLLQVYFEGDPSQAPPEQSSSFVRVRSDTTERAHVTAPNFLETRRSFPSDASAEKTPASACLCVRPVSGSDNVFWHPPSLSLLADTRHSQEEKQQLGFSL